MEDQSSPLYEVHADLGASFTEFGGWQMPVEFSSIREEHLAVREAVGVFDVSHMGQIEVAGPDARALMNRLTTNDVSKMRVGDAQYAAITTEDGTMLDDTITYRLPDGSSETSSGSDEPAYLFVPNAGADETMTDRWRTYRDEWGLDASVENLTHEFGMLAVQGPSAEEAVAGAVSGPDDSSNSAGASESSLVQDLGFFKAAFEVGIDGVDCLVARTGYTGEDGFELLFPAASAEDVWAAFASDCTPCGLGARDTLRLEAGLLLSGQDFHPEDEPRTPLEAGIGFAVALESEFVGRDALVAVDDAGVDERLVGFSLVDRGIARHGHTAFDGDEELGPVTSGTMSPTLDRAIGLAYLPVAYTEPETAIEIDVRGRRKKAKVERLPFVDTNQ